MKIARGFFLFYPFPTLVNYLVFYLDETKKYIILGKYFYHFDLNNSQMLIKNSQYMLYTNVPVVKLKNSIAFFNISRTTIYVFTSIEI